MSDEKLQFAYNADDSDLFAGLPKGERALAHLAASSQILKAFLAQPTAHGLIRVDRDITVSKPVTHAPALEHACAKAQATAIYDNLTAFATGHYTSFFASFVKGNLLHDAQLVEFTKLLGDVEVLPIDDTLDSTNKRSYLIIDSPLAHENEEIVLEQVLIYDSANNLSTTLFHSLAERS
jgi:hypothetical protein